ncbi:MAG: caspase domain-containing protein [Myxococcota bacterium]
MTRQPDQKVHPPPRLHPALLRFGWLLCLLSLCSAPLRASDKPELYLLAIGTSDYQDPTVQDLKYADDDATAMIQWAESQRGRLYSEVHTRLLTNQEVTRTQVIQALLEHFRAARPNDQLILFLSGHGLVDPKTQAWHYLTHDSLLTSIAGTALEQNDILRKLESNGKKNRLLVLVDTCDSGALTQAIPKDGKGLFVAGEVRPINDEEANARQGLWAIYTAGSAVDKAVEGPEFRLPNETEGIAGHGLFTWAILRALLGAGADKDGSGTVTLNEFHAFVSHEVRTHSGGKQLPLISGRLTDTALGFVPGTVEKCDGIDNDLDGETDEGFDQNRNRIGDCMESEKCNGIDDNGDGQVDEGFDLDGDGYRARELCGQTYGDDCDDHHIAVHPQQKDWGNLRDDDCDGLFDEDDFDHDGDTITDVIDHHASTLSRIKWAGLGVGVFTLLGSSWSLNQQHELEQIDVTKRESFKLTDAEKARYERLRTLSAGLLTSSALSLGVSLSFTFQELNFRRIYFPKVRSWTSQTAHADTPTHTLAKRSLSATLPVLHPSRVSDVEPPAQGKRP